MKTAISLPDDTFERATRKAGDLGVSRSRFFATAAERYLDALDEQALTDQIDDAVIRLDGADDDSAVVDRGRAVLAEVQDDW